MKNKKFKINLFDSLFILLILVLLFCAWYRFFGTSDKEVLQNNDKITYTAVIENIEIYNEEQIKVGDKLFAKTIIDNEYDEIGTIKDIKISQYEETTLKLDGTYEIISLPNKYKVELQVETNGKITNMAYYSSSNFELYTNEKFDATTKYMSFPLMITQINGGENVESR